MPVALSDGFTIHTKHATTLFYTVQCVCLIAKGVGGHTVHSVAEEATLRTVWSTWEWVGRGEERRGVRRGDL